MSRTFDAVVFDLDGTLIDSAPGILQGFADAFARCQITPKGPWSSSLIGPPLVQTIAQQCVSQDPALLEQIRQAFIDCYDTAGYRLSTPYRGVHAMLESMRHENLRLFIATNKRITPTQRILDHLGWRDYFEGVFGVDSLERAQSPKADVIRHIALHFGLDHDHSLYVGDRYEDYEAASSAGLPFSLATWGFGDADALVPRTCARVQTAESLLSLVSHPPAI